MATQSLKELLAQQEALDAKIKELRAEELADAIGKVRALVEEYSLTQQDIFPSKSGAKAARKTTTTKVAAKYLDPITGNQWSGRGLPPKWLAGKNKEDYAIA